MSDKQIFLENDDFDENGVLKIKNGVILIYSSKCPHCSLFEPIYKQLKLKNKHIPFFYIQRDINLPEHMVKQHSLMFQRMKQITQDNFIGYPTLIKFKNGNLSVFKNSRTPENVQKWLDE